ncbi:1-deoxy-D-xylulose-5-phosphate reductoisomerase [Parvularcula sp. IMCC14364]|uniref:1-deoxy-D-xylulose-5-phosphate reductoisomerase n=1 Tax=Parvularcula sp. IMCC14364 TaxID=3067902 RepID=UPI00274204FA|nr:1-deoxy-D-xylulose-5-phosphate reductoisomerase [Parvularcula sp. IMCC14364]
MNLPLQSVKTDHVSNAKDQVPRRISIFGSTGSVGENTLDLISFAQSNGAANMEVVALTANRNARLLAEQAIRYGADFAVVADDKKYDELKAHLQGTEIACGAGDAAMLEAAEMEADWVMAAIVGAAGLQPTLTAARRGADIAFANKECLVCAGSVFTGAMKQGGGRLLPVDSEHNAIFQVYDFDRPERITRILLTASGGPFRTWTRAQMAAVSVEQAVAHPNWSMGAKISIDSATMMNKGLELIEAARLFPTPSSDIEIIVHPQSVIHSMVEYVDGSVLAQMGTPDMRTPIASALAWPDRVASPSPKLDFSNLANLTFEEADAEKFPALRLSREALELDGLAPTALNAANEIAVEAFLKRHLKFLDITAVTEQVLTSFGFAKCDGEITLEDVLETDKEARRKASDIVATLSA